MIDGAKHKSSKPLLVCTNIIPHICEQCITNLEIFFKYVRKFLEVRMIGFLNDAEAQKKTE